MTSTKDSKETKEVAEKDVTYNAYAATKKGGTLEPFKYHPRILGTNDVEIKISHCGICGSDIHTIDSGWGPSTYPVIVGHEIIGVVTKAGGNCKLLKVGDRVGVGAQVFACHKNDCHDCMHDDDPHCPKKVFTYDDRYPDGELTRGGYAEFVRVHEDFAFKIPDALSSAEAAPLMCAGATVWQPMVDHNVKWGSKVAVVGMGGLGHLALQFAAKMGADVTVVTHSTNKKEDALKLGAKNVLDLNDEKAMKSAAYSMDMLVITSNQDDANFTMLLSLLRTRGVAVLCAAPNSGVKMHPFGLIIKKVSMCGSLLASSGQIKIMLDFAAKHGVKPIIEKMAMKDVNKGIERVRSGKVRYRVVLCNEEEKKKSS
eukprot:TRINITY_DN7374_c0_g1_i1.p1 TRINITY_DN7374_c0_g1~~TRINITY_DN7374_c0_g1_i1.p1  ORF type:complete len:418 (-),score=126.92 TRINITY_DN7374_c0_g1_i1:167-1276(-)